MAFIMSWHESGDTDGAAGAAGRLARFRHELYFSFGMRRDALFDLAERIASAIIIIAERDFGLLGAAFDITKRDWRDLLSSSGLEMEDWRLKVDALLGSPA